jgi:hypothetical protein
MTLAPLAAKAPRFLPPLRPTTEGAHGQAQRKSWRRHQEMGRTHRQEICDLTNNKLNIYIYICRNICVIIVYIYVCYTYNIYVLYIYMYMIEPTTKVIKVDELYAFTEENYQVIESESNISTRKNKLKTKLNMTFVLRLRTPMHVVV